MTQLNKSVKRVTNNTRSTSGRSLVIELRPGATETIFIRKSGRRAGYTVPIAKVYALGARLEADAKRAEKTAKKKMKKRGN